MSLSVDISATIDVFSLEIRFESAGRVTSLFGRSGAGKSTLLSLIAGLAKPSRGHIEIDGTVLFDAKTRQNIAASRRRIGYVFQDARLFPHMTVRNNLRYGERRAPEAERWASFDHVVDLLGIAGLLDRRPGRLSGGEMQRVAIGRALLSSPRLLLLDEPLASVDAARRSELLPYLEGLRDETRIPIIHVSHTVDEVIRLADEVVLIDGGRSIASGTINDVFSRLDLMHLTGHHDAGVALQARVTSHDATTGIARLDHAGGTLSVPDLTLPVGSLVRVRIRSRDVAVAVGDIGSLSIRNRLAATVTAIADDDGPLVDVHLDVGGDPLIARITAEAAVALKLAPGLAVTALVKTAAIGNREND
ncbi:MAG: molybdenum ABC transporter ATP-binding protein [Alphaproteobacteria bacterium]